MLQSEFPKGNEGEVMKIGGSKILSTALAVALLGSVAIAQGPRAGMHGGGMFSEHSLDFFADILNLSDAQQAQIKQITSASKATMEPLFQQEMQNRKAMMQLAMSGAFDDAKAQTIAQQSAQIHSQIELEHARVISQAYQVLTAAQKTQLSQFLAKREQRMQEHMQAKTGSE
jgi:Spy/CpxP family protein refolding chaperone